MQQRQCMSCAISTDITDLKRQFIPMCLLVWLQVEANNNIKTSPNFFLRSSDTGYSAVIGKLLQLQCHCMVGNVSIINVI